MRHVAFNVIHKSIIARQLVQVRLWCVDSNARSSAQQSLSNALQIVHGQSIDACAELLATEALFEPHDLTANVIGQNLHLTRVNIRGASVIQGLTARDSRFMNMLHLSWFLARLNSVVVTPLLTSNNN